jgi:hypothetical protein
MSMLLRTGLRTNALVWITSLEATDIGSSERTLDTLAHIFRKLEFPIIRFTPTNASELLNLLEAIANKVRLQAFRPIIHIDTHGSKDHGLKIAGSEEFVAWVKLCEGLRKINLGLNNDLCVVSAACFGFAALEGLDVARPSPFYILVAPENKTHFEFVAERIVGFYESVFSGGDLVSVYKEYLQQELNLFSCEAFVLRSLAEYVKENMLGKNKRKRVEATITKRISEGYSSAPSNLRLMRKLYKGLIKPTPDFIRRNSEEFMIGRELSFGVPEVLELARQISRNPRRQKNI